MKKRILSLLLLTAMLLTAIPVMTSAAEISTTEDTLDYAELYVTDGLTGLFTAYGNVSDVDLNANDGGSGTWYNRVEGGFNGSLGNASRWYKKTSVGGGVGFNVFSGEITADGTFNATSAYDNWKESYAFLNFGGDNLPAEDYTVQYVAMHKPIYVVNAADGSIAVDSETGAYIESHDMNPGFSAGAQDSRVDKAPLFSLGYFNAYGVAVDTDTDTWGMKRGCMVWIGNQINWAGANKSWWIGTGSCTWNRNSGMSWNWTTGDAFIKNDQIITYMITLDETTSTTSTETTDETTGETTTTETTVTTALFSLYRDAALWQSNANAINSTANAGGPTYYIDNWGGNFFLSAGVPIEYYSVRIYDRLLTASEQNRNHMVDILMYYGLTVYEEFMTNTALQNDATALFVSEGFETDATLYAEKKAALQTNLNAIRQKTLGGAANIYVTDGLTALFTAYDDTYIDLDAGTWTDRIMGKTATFGNAAKGYWTLGTNGGVGVTMLYGSYIDGVFTETVDTNNFNVLGTRLEFGIDLLPVVDYTVEYVAQYNSVMAVGADGKPVQALNTISDAIWPNNAALSNQTVATTAIDQLGNLQSFANSGRDKAFATGAESYYGGLGSVAFKHNANRAANGWNSGSGSAGLFKASEIWQTRGSINTFEISRDATGYTNNVITLTRNGAVYSSKTFTESIANEHTGGDDYFYLGERLSVDYYAVRIYNRILTAEERQQNHLADLLLYYGVTVPASFLEDEAAIATKTAEYASTTLLTDATEKAAQKLTMQKDIEQTYGLSGAASLYVQDGMTGLFTAFDANGDYISSNETSNGSTWQNRLGGFNVWLKADITGIWELGKNGGVGYNYLYGYLDETDTFVSASVGKSGIGSAALVFGGIGASGIANLPQEDATVEYVAEYKPVYLSADSTGSAIATDAEGNLLETYDYQGYGISGWASWPIDSIGWFQAYTNKLDGAEWSGGRGSIHFVMNSTYWSSGGSGRWVGGNAWKGDGGLNIAGNPFHQLRVIQTYEYSLDETVTTVDGTTTTTALFALYRNGSLYKDNSSALNTSANGTAYNGYYNYSESGNGNSFHLSAGCPTDFYAVRVYAKTLTDAERKQNHLADLLLFYGVEMPEGLNENATAVASLATTLASVTFAKDETGVAANKATITAALADATKTVTFEANGATEDVTVYGDSYTLPTTLFGKTVYAWSVSGTSYIPGTDITVTDGMTVSAKTLSTPKTTAAPSVKPNEDVTKAGMRFTATVNKAEYMEIVELYGYEYMTLGMLIAPEAYVEAAGAFTREALQAYVDVSNSSSGDAYIDVQSRGFLTVTETTCTLAGTVINFGAKTLAKNPSFAAVAYINIDVDKDGAADFTVYGDYNAETNSTVTAAFNNALTAGSATDTEKQWIRALLAKFTA